MKLFLFLIIGYIGAISASKLNVPKLLLPYYSSVTTNFTLEVSDGCFTWHSTRPEIASVEPIDSKDASRCSQTAVVMATSRVPNRKTAIVTAEDRVSGAKLRCDVIVDEIFSIAIETTTHELYLDDSPEEFVIRAMNEEGDVFSSLDGVPFEWNLRPDIDSSQNVGQRNNILRLISFHESSYEALPYIKDLEHSGKQGDRILVRGDRTGSAKVTAVPDDSAYKNVKEASVRIIVMANIQISPPFVYLMQHTTVKYTVELIKQNKVQHIAMPSQQYYLEVANKDIASMNERTSTATALFMGDTDVLLKDRNINMAGMFREPSAGIYVVNPSYLAFQIFPDKNWVLQTGRVYEVTIEVLDKGNHKIYPSDNIRIEATFPPEYFEVQRSSENGTHHVVKTLKRGITDIHGLLDAVLLKDGKRHQFSPPVEQTQEAEIYDPVKVAPKIVVLPWIPMKDNNYQFELEATGGSGNYSWSSSVPNVAAVTYKGQIITATVTGETVVKAADSKNLAHFDTMQTFVLPPKGMEFLSSRVEAELGTHLELPLAVFGEKGGRQQRFHECHLMPIEVVLTDKAVFQHVEELAPVVEGSCASIKVKALSQGHTELKVIYKFKDIQLKASVTIAAYRPLRPVDPEELTLVTPASSRDMTFEGGPQPWVLDGSRYYQQLQAEVGELVTIQPVKKLEGQKSRHVFRVLCTQLGEQTLSLKVGNRPTAKNQIPAESTASVKFACAEPRGIRLIPLVKYPVGLPPCPVNPEYDDPIPVQNYRDLDIQVTVKDPLGRKFDNFSSLEVRWELGDAKLAGFTILSGKQAMVTRVIQGEKARIVTVRTLSMKGLTDMLEVKAVVIGYRKEYFLDRIFQLQSPELISDTRVLSLVDDAVIQPEYLTVYNHAANKADLHILHGSGHFNLDYANVNQAKVQFDDKRSRDITLLPLSEGQFVITANDLCIEVRATAKATVFVSDVHRIELKVVDKVEIYKEITAEVQVFDVHGQAIPAKYYNRMSLKPKTGADIISLRPAIDKLKEESLTATYIIKGMILGRTSLQFIANQKTSRIVSSSAEEIQVFPPLRLMPRNITLIVGAHFQVTAHGGPQPQSSIEFSILNQKIAGVSSTGLLEASQLGSTRVVGRAVGVDGTKGLVVYSQDEVTVNVIQLEGVKIFAPLKRLQTDTQMPLYAMGVGENESPFTFGSAAPPLRFHWSISNKDVATLNPLFYESSIVPGPENNFAVRLFAEEAGHVTVRLSVSTSEGSQLQIRGNRKLTDDVQIQVFERLRLTSPSVCDGKLLMTPDTETKVTTNRDGSTARLTYSVQTVVKTPIVSVDEYGHLVSGSESGEASLILTSHEEFGVNQTLIIQVQIRPVSYLMINADTLMHVQPHSDLDMVPLGTSLQFSVSFHDSVGEKFYATNSKIRFMPNRNDLLQISHGATNDTLIAKATNVGETIFKVWDQDDSRLVDYVNIAVGYAIRPAQETFMLGDVVCFTSPLQTQDGHSGYWLSSNNVLHTQAHSGVSLATQVGTGILTYNISATLTTHTEVSVQPISSLHLVTESVTFLTNVMNRYQPETKLVPIVLKNGRGGIAKTSVHGPNCTGVLEESDFTIPRLPVRCEVSLSAHHSHVLPEDIVKVDTTFDVHSGRYQCSLTQVFTSDLNAVISGLDTKINLRAVVTAREGQPEVVSEVTALPYIPGFSVQPMEVLLSNHMPVVKLRVTATKSVLENLQVESMDTNLVAVASRELDSQASSVAHYPIHLQHTSGLWERHQLETMIEIKSELTGQFLEVPVKVKLIGYKEDQPKNVLASWTDILAAIGQNYQSIILTLIYIILTVACIVIAYHVILGQRYQAASQQSGVFLQPGSPQQQQQQQGMLSPWNTPSPPPGSSPSRLWSVDYSPYDKSSLYNRSPSRLSPQRN